jgi:hypothetical protein
LPTPWQINGAEEKLQKVSYNPENLEYDMASIFEDQDNFLLKGGNDKNKEVYDDNEEEDEIEATGKLKDLDLDQELWQQFARAKLLYKEARKDKSLLPNQKAVVLNTISAILSNVVKMQESLHNVQRLKGIEAALIDTLKKFPDIKEAFLQAYGKELESKDA